MDKLDTSVKPQVEKKLNGTQRLEVLESTVNKLSQLIDQQGVILAQEIDLLRAAIVKLNQRINAAIQAGEGGNLSGNAVEGIMIENDIKKMKADIEHLTKMGILTKDDNMVSAEDTFVVGRNLDKDGKIINERLQFAISTLADEEIKQMFQNSGLDILQKIG